MYFYKINRKRKTIKQILITLKKEILNFNDDKILNLGTKFKTTI